MTKSFLLPSSPRYRLNLTKFEGPSTYIGHIFGTMAQENNTEHPSTSSPGVSKTNVPPCGGSEQVVRIRLPRHFAVELANVLVLDVRVCREINSDYSFVHVRLRRHILLYD